MPTTGLTFTWTTPPSVIVSALTSYEQRIQQALGLLADTFAAKMEAQAKGQAPWSDRTGAARQGLRGMAEKAATRIVIYLIHSVSYGVYLERGTSKMAPRPVIMPVLEANYGAVMAAARALVGG